MKENREARTEPLLPHAQLIQMSTGYWVSKIVYVAAKLCLADHLADRPKSAAELAGQTRTDEPSLHRQSPQFSTSKGGQYHAQW